jgi:hypothetical protein
VGGSSSSSGGELPLLARELGVSVASLGRLFRAEAEADFEQPVWMVVNLQVGLLHTIRAGVLLFRIYSEYKAGCVGINPVLCVLARVKGECGWFEAAVQGGGGGRL